MYRAFQQALWNYRNCPRYDGLSPAQWYFGRRQRTEAVAFPSAYERIPDHIVAEHELQRQRKTDKLRTHANKSSRPKQQLHIGQPVIAQHVLTKRWDQRGEIVENCDNGRSYLVQMNGRQYLRNRCFLCPLPKQQHARHKQRVTMGPQPPGDYDMRSQNQPFHHISTLIRPQTQALRPDRAPKRPWPCEQNTTPTRAYPQRLRRQRTHYQAAIPQPKRRNRPWNFRKKILRIDEALKMTFV